MEDETPVQEPAAEPAPKKRKKGKLGKILMFVLPVLLLMGGGAFWMLSGSSATVQAEAEVKIEERGIVPFETFLVNLSDPGGTRFLKVTLQLVFPSEAEAKHVQENAALMGHARSAILVLLTEQNAQALVTIEGKKKLTDAVKASVAKIISKQKVVDVLFSEFVVQF